MDVSSTPALDALAQEAVLDGKTAAEWRALALKEKRQRVKLQRANRKRLGFGAGGLTRAFLCIHSFEGSWSASTGNGFYGGLQMDSSFMRGYGGEFYRAWGPANRWPPFVQVAVALRAYFSGRGFGPWPNTARMCGLR